MGIVEAERYKLIPVDQLLKAEWNYKEENEELTEKLTKNIKRNGQIENILVRTLPTGFYEVVNGNHRLDVLMALEAPNAFCYDLGEITQQEAMRVAIETNETKFKTDSIKLGELFKEISEEFDLNDLIETLPYDNTQITDLIKLSDFSWDEYDNQGSGEGAGDDTFGDKGNSKECFINLTVSENQYEKWLDWLEFNNKRHDLKEHGRMFELALDFALQAAKEAR